MTMNGGGFDDCARREVVKTKIHMERTRKSAPGSELRGITVAQFYMHISIYNNLGIDNDLRDISLIPGLIQYSTVAFCRYSLDWKDDDEIQLPNPVM
jgi:hypothetical protein